MSLWYAMAVAPVNAWLIGFLLSLMAYGTYLPVFKDCMIMLHKQCFTLSKPRWHMVLVAISLFILTTINIMAQIKRAYTAFSVGPNSPVDKNAYLNSVDDTLAIIQNVTYAAGLLVADFIMVYRVYVIWSFSPFFAALPFALWLGNIALTSWSVEAQVNFKVTSVLTSNFSRRSTYVVILTSCLNIISAILISLRIWRLLPPSQSSLSGKAIRTFVESAGAYCVCLIILIATAYAKSYAYVIFWLPLPAIVPIIFSAIIIRMMTEIEQQETIRLERTTLKFSSSRSSHTLNTTEIPTTDIEAEEGRQAVLNLQSDKSAFTLGASRKPELAQTTL